MLRLIGRSMKLRFEIGCNHPGAGVAGRSVCRTGSGQLRDSGVWGRDRGKRPHHGGIAQRLYGTRHTTSTDGTIPTNHPFYETLEITHGFTNWFETGFYLFTSVQNGYGWDYVGDHIRPRVRVPPSWHWPVGVSISQEFGYQRAQFSADTCTYELRPIIDKQLGRWYFAFNPAFDKSFHEPSASQGFIFSPDAKVSYDSRKKITGGIEY
jgi:hypothetical protein